MALTAEDLKQLGEFIEGKVSEAVKAKSDASSTPETEQAKPEEWYVHLADGQVVILPADEVSTSYDGIQVIGKYRVGD
jgi:hypothetical protein